MHFLNNPSLFIVANDRVKHQNTQPCELQIFFQLLRFQKLPTACLIYLCPRLFSLLLRIQQALFSVPFLILAVNKFANTCKNKKYVIRFHLKSEENSLKMLLVSLINSHLAAMTTPKVLNSWALSFN
jgi:hypothetical protein